MFEHASERARVCARMGVCVCLRTSDFYYVKRINSIAGAVVGFHVTNYRFDVCFACVNGKRMCFRYDR